MVLGASCNQLAQGIANTISSGVTYYAGKKLQEAQKKYNDTLTQLNAEYSGENANNRITNAAQEQANITSNREMDAAKQQTAGSGNAMANANKAEQNVANAGAKGYTSGYSEGAQNENTLMQGEYAGKKAEADAKLEQAQTNYKAGMAAASGLQKLGQAASSAFSDERGKESPINNDSGLPESDIEDSLRQLETVSYKYKDPNIEGCDDETHDSGFIAQSAEKTPLYKDAVQTGDDGYKRVDEWRLLEAVTAGISQLQREIDELNAKPARKKSNGRIVHAN